jgi:secreted PhoX family phosphatase
MGCSGGSSQRAEQIFVSDAGNNRLLIYNAPLSMGKNAGVVLGQAAFDAQAAPIPPTAQSMNLPLGVALDSSGNLYVADSSNCRVLQFSPPFALGQAANFALGQASGATNLTTNVCGVGWAGLSQPSGMAFDSTGNLWVADGGNNRVLMYPKANLVAGGSATVVLGQADQSGSSCNQGVTTQNPATPKTLCLGLGPFGGSGGGIAFDSSGNLWVSDTSNSRVLMYPPANMVTNGAATVELGQPAGALAFNSADPNSSGVTANSLAYPAGIAFDSSGNLWTADALNSRVLMYPKANLGTNGAAATLVLGQPAFTSLLPLSSCNADSNIGPSTLAIPIGIGFDNSGNLLVLDSGNNRMLQFVSPFKNNMNATLALGQQTLTNGDPNPGGESAATLYTNLFPYCLLVYYL